MITTYRMRAALVVPVFPSANKITTLKRPFRSGDASMVCAAKARHGNRGRPTQTRLHDIWLSQTHSFVAASLSARVCSVVDKKLIRSIVAANRLKEAQHEHYDHLLNLCMASAGAGVMERKRRDGRCQAQCRLLLHCHDGKEGVSKLTPYLLPRPKAPLPPQLHFELEDNSPKKIRMVSGRVSDSGLENASRSKFLRLVAQLVAQHSGV
ncbi:hypothetical protein BJ170DRAFT_464853 [Xylariales sp. AK1849]|nr:hypothetical protein BJ170DRAFT_464853 [Xylariales sp. AK1849]